MLHDFLNNNICWFLIITKVNTHFADIDVWNKHCMISFSTQWSTSASNNEQSANF
jgi:hypothetical protein